MKHLKRNMMRTFKLEKKLSQNELNLKFQVLPFLEQHAEVRLFCLVRLSIPKAAASEHCRHLVMPET